ncbi:MAG: hypothetical protein JF609_06890 [Verrucomicrobia bacterium]|nr:hypothetical protein [Verrucomicrobiota bacterium]
MKLLRREEDEFELEFALEEKSLFFHLLGLYPAVPASYHRLTKGKKIRNQDENQQLLDDAIQAQRETNQKEIFKLVSKHGRFTDGEENSRAVFKRDELEWLLQVINDVRIGCWIALGSPGAADERKLKRDKNSLRQLMMMEIAGGFEMFILGVVSGRMKPGADEE